MHVRALSALAIPAACLAIAACGSGKGSATASAGAAADAFKFSRCMREHGVTDFPDPKVGPGGAMMLRFNGAAKVSPQTMEAAQRACRRDAPGEQRTLTPQQRAELQDAALKFARCMREHGVDVPDPDTTSGGGIRIQFNRRAGSPNPESPAFQTAQKACQGLLPLKGGRGPRFDSSGPRAGTARAGASVGIGPGGG